MIQRRTETGVALALLGAALLAPALAAGAQDGEPADDDERFLAGETAAAEPAGEGAAGADAQWGGRLRDHRRQGFVNILTGTGWYLVAPYEKNEPDKACGFNDKGEGEAVCSGRSGFHLDFLGGFGVLAGLEVFAMFRLGVERPDERLPETRLVGAGIKVYSPADGLFKLAFGAAPLFDFSERRAGGYDFLLHVPIAAHFDFLPWLGAYAQVAPNISFVTEFKFDITAGLGLQGRFP